MIKEILNTLLWIATLKGCVPVVKLCLNLGADVDNLFEDLRYRDKLNNSLQGSVYSLTHYAVLTHNLRLLKIFLKHRPILDSRNSCNQSILITALLEDNVEIVEALLDHLKRFPQESSARSEAFYSEIACAFRNPNIEIYKKVLDFGFDINAVYHYGGETPIYSILSGTFFYSDSKTADLERLKMLLDKYYIDWSVQTKLSQETPFESVAFRDYVSDEDLLVLRKLINKNLAISK